MRIKLFSSSGIFQNSVILDGFTMIGFLTLYRNPDDPLEAATKRYVDSFPTLYNVSQITGSTIPKSLLVGGFGGDLMGFNAVDAFLTPTGVQAGTYNSVTVNAKGRITAATNEARSPGSASLQFANITGRPVNASGYVADASGYAIKNFGTSSAVTLTGNLRSSVTPVNDTHAATKAYASQKLANASGYIPVGALKYTTAAAVDSKYLRANGGVLDKTTYAALYAVIGDTYSADNIGYMGQPWRQQCVFNTSQSVDLTNWTNSGGLPSSLAHTQAVVTKNRVYLLGGYIGSGYTAAVLTASINSDGTLGTWEYSRSLPIEKGYSQAFVTKNWVYVVGGYDFTGAVTTTVYAAPINADGTLGNWVRRGDLPSGLAASQVVVTQNRVYLIAGYNGSAAVSSTVYTAPINADGTLGSWSTAALAPIGIVYHQIVVTKNRVYLLGGYTDGHVNNVYTASINSDGTLGSWTSGIALPIAVSNTQVVVTQSKVYLMGGNGNTGYTASIMKASINADGTLGTWSDGGSLPATWAHSQAIVTSSRIYLIGGVSNGTYTNGVWSVAFNGGSNDYVALIAANTVNASTQFKLPDYSSKTNGSLEYFIRAIA